jgi:hypothetical protein
VTYVLHPGEVVSRNDGDRHYIGVGALIELYRIPRGARVRVDDGRTRWPDDAIHCRPLYSGDYPVFSEERR